MVCSSKLEAQTKYKIVYKIDPIFQGSFDELSHQMKQMKKKVINYAEGISYVLMANRNESHFEEEKSLKIKTLGRVDEVFMDYARGFTPFYEMTYANYEKDSLIFIKNLLDQDFKVHREFYDLNWKIKDSTKQILGFKAKKVEGVYHYPITNKDIKVTAWFLPALPLQTGPDVFVGLPGLIAEIQTKKAIVRATKIEKLKSQKIERINDKDAMSQKEFQNLLSKMREKFIGK